MKATALACLAVIGLTTFACKPGGANTTTAPTPLPTSQPASVNISSKGPILNGQQTVDDYWTGDMSWNEQSGTNTMGLNLEQTGAQVTGEMNIYGPDGGGGPIAGNVSGNTFRFNFSIGNGGQGCGNTASGTATIVADTMTGSFSGKRCNGDKYTNGQFKVTLPYPFRASAYPLAGTWTLNVPAAAGGGRWTFNIAETIKDASGGALTGSVAVANSSLSLGAGSMTATVTNTYPGPRTAFALKVTFDGACAATFTLGLAIEGSNPFFYGGGTLGGGLSGMTCNGEVPLTQGINLTKG